MNVDEFTVLAALQQYDIGISAEEIARCTRMTETRAEEVLESLRTKGLVKDRVLV